jgi:hypothetical protein
MIFLRLFSTPWYPNKAKIKEKEKSPSNDVLCRRSGALQQQLVSPFVTNRQPPADDLSFHMISWQA